MGWFNLDVYPESLEKTGKVVRTAARSGMKRSPRTKTNRDAMAKKRLQATSERTVGDAAAGAQQRSRGLHRP